jgi:ketosteroid isomerase-like protein
MLTSTEQAARWALRCRWRRKTGDLPLKSLRFSLYALILLTAAGSNAAIQPAAARTAGRSARATVEIKQLMAAYHQAVVSHDGARLSSMFIDNGSTWFNVLSDAAYASARAKNPAASRVRHQSFQWFANIVSTSHAALDPEHSDVRILTDGTIASVYFNFVFLIDGKPENQGSETWQLLKTRNGWKIAAITYSSNPPPPP